MKVKIGLKLNMKLLIQDFKVATDNDKMWIVINCSFNFTFLEESDTESSFLKS